MLPQAPMLLILAFLTLFGQENDELQIHSFGSCRGKQIAHTLGSVLFCIPRGMKVHRNAGFEGDVQDVVTLSLRGETGKLMVHSDAYPLSGRQKSMPEWFPADPAAQSSVRTWRCSEGTGRDYRLSRDQRRWRMITFPLGWAEYNDVAPDIAVQFDRVIDSLGCRPLTNR